MPTFAPASWLPWKASEAISSDTMKPMPATAPAPITAAQPTGGRIAPATVSVAAGSGISDPLPWAVP